MSFVSARRARFFHRAVAAAVAGLHLVLVLGAGGHTGDHAAAGLESLPLEYHDHVYEWTTASDGAVHVQESCVACHLQRSGLDLPGLGSLAAAEPPDTAGPTVDAETRPRGPAFRPQPIRGPPVHPSA